MAQENIDRLRAAYEVLAATGEWPSGELLGAAFELHQDAFVDNAKVFRGPDAPAELLGVFAESFLDLSLEAESFTAAPRGEVVAVVRLQGRGRASGMAIDKLQAHVWSFDDLAAIKMEVFGQPAEARKAVRLSE